MTTARNRVSFADGGGSAVHSGNLGFQVLNPPVVITFSRRIEADGNGIEGIGYYELSVVRTAAVELLFVEGEFMVRWVVAPGVDGTGIVAYTGHREGVSLILGVFFTRVDFKARHIFGETQRTGVALFGRVITIVSRGVVEEDLQVLVAVLLLLRLEFQCHTELCIEEIEVCLVVIVVE